MNKPELTISAQTVKAALFNLDGVVTRITKLHIEAWQRLFDAYLGERSSREGEDYRSFDADHDYRRYVDGRPRYQAAKHFLLARHIDLPMGEVDDPPDRETVFGLGNRKNRIFQQIVDSRGVEVYGCAIALIHRLRKAGIKTAAVSASTHSDLILERARIADLFDVRVDGALAERLDLDSKPDPDTFLEAAQRLEVEPAATAVFEDTIIGITAGKRGRFGLVGGVDPGGQAQKMREHGADRVLQDLGGVDLDGDGHAQGDAIPTPLTDMAWISGQVAGQQPALFLDYGGALAPIVDRPEDARLSATMRRILREAAPVLPVVVVSGHDLQKLVEAVGISEIVYAGSHGLEIRGPDLSLELPQGVDALEDLEGAAKQLAESLSGVPGVRLERKRFAIVVHYRQAAERVHDSVAAVQARFPRLQETGGKEVFELLPAIHWDKGRAVRWLLSELDLDGTQVAPIYVGDDSTDEDAFRVVRARGGFGILVSEQPRPSAATYRVQDTDQVAALLQHLVATAVLH